MGAILSGIGSLGTSLGEARLQNEQLKKQDIQDRLNNLLSQLNLDEGQVRLGILKRQAQQATQPQVQGTITLPGGGIGAIVIDPNTGIPSLKTLAGGMDVSTVKGLLTKIQGNLAPEDQKVIQTYGDELDAGADPLQVLNKAQTYAAGKIRTEKPPIVKAGADRYAETVTDRMGNEYDASDPNLPPNLAALVKAHNARTDEFYKKQEDEKQRQFNNEMARLRTSFDFGTQRLLQSNAVKSYKDAETAYDTYQSVKDIPQRLAGAGSPALTRVLLQRADKLFGGSEETKRYEDRFKHFYTAYGAGQGSIDPKDAQEIVDAIKEVFDTKRGQAYNDWQFAMPADKPMPDVLKPPAEAPSGGGSNLTDIGGVKH